MVTHQSFVDESGTHDSSLVTIVGGYLFESHAAEQFQNSWTDILYPFRDRGITYFHSGKCALGKPPFDKLNHAERLSLFRQMADLIKATAFRGVFVELEAHVYHEWKKGNPTVNSLVGSKYAACLFQYFLFLRQILRNDGTVQNIHYVFERVGDGKGKKPHPFDKERDDLLAIIEASDNLTADFRFGGKSSHAKGKMHALEAADVMLWTYSSIRGEPEDFTRISRQAFAEGKVRHSCATMTHAALTNIARLNNDLEIRENTHIGPVRIYNY